MSTFTPDLQLENPAIGATGWGVSESTSRTLIDNYTAGIETLSVAGSANVVLTSVSGASDQARWSHFVFNGALTGNVIVLFPNGLSRNFTVNNATTGAFTLAIGVSNGSGGAAGTTVTVPAGLTAFLLSDGTNITTRFNTFVGGLTVDTLTLINGLGVVSGGTGLTTLTAHAVIAGNGTSPPNFIAPGTSGNLLTSNGTDWTSAAAPIGGVTSIADATNGGLHFSGSTGAVTANIAPGDATSKATPVAADLILIGDSAASSALKSATISSVFGVFSSVAQVVNFQTGAVNSGSTLFTPNDTIPVQSGGATAGDQYMSLAITPKNAASTLRIDVVAQLSNSGTNNNSYAALFQDATVNALAVGAADNEPPQRFCQVAFTYFMVAGTTSSTTFKIRAGGDGGTTTFNGNAGSRLFGGVFASSITITEYLP